MCEILIKINCPHCQSSKVVKNGKKRNGGQNLLCKSCRKQFQASYRNKGADPAVKQLVLRHLERNSGIWDREGLLGISRWCFLDNLCRRGNIIASTARQRYRSVQIDEVWSSEGSAGRGILAPVCLQPETDEVLANSCGGRSAMTVRELLRKLEGWK